MKRGTPDHPKTKRLSVLLGKPRYEVVGVLESMWHFTASYAKRGDIGRWSNEEIAAGIEWGGDVDALILALIQSGFLDECPEHRLLVHDWANHADQSVQRSEDVKRLGFARQKLATTSFQLDKASEQLETTSILQPDVKSCQPAFLSQCLSVPLPLSQSHSDSRSLAEEPPADTPREELPPATQGDVTQAIQHVRRQYAVWIGNPTMNMPTSWQDKIRKAVEQNGLAYVLRVTPATLDTAKAKVDGTHGTMGWGWVENVLSTPPPRTHADDISEGNDVIAKASRAAMAGR